jgi:hypothetical protein
VFFRTTAPSLHRNRLSPHELFRHLDFYVHLPACRHLLHRIISDHSTAHTQEITGPPSFLLLSQFPGEGTALLTAALAHGAEKLMRKRVLIVDTISQTLSDSPYKRYSHLNAVDPESSEHSKSATDPTQRVQLAAPRVDLTIARAVPETAHARYTTNEICFSRVRTESPVLSDFILSSYLESLHRQYDLILIESCALTALDEDSLHPAILASYADSTIAVLSSRGMERTALLSLRDLVARHRIKLSGFVCNGGPQL